MIDTIVLVLNKNMFTITEPDKFEPTARKILEDSGYMGSRGYLKCAQNPTPKELKSGIYKPRLTLTQRINRDGRREPSLKIELSLPKLIYGNNFDELQDSDFEIVTEKLNKTLKDMGVLVFMQILVSAPVSAVHYSKNIPLTDGSTPHYVINKIKEAGVNLALDVNQTDYRNDGSCYRWHCNSYEIAFYDKLKDLMVARKSEKRAIEKDNSLQLNLFERLTDKPIFEVLRMEVRLNKRQKIKQLLNSLNIETESSFQNLFNASVSKCVLFHYLDQIEDHRNVLSNYKMTTDKDFLVHLVTNNLALGAAKSLQIFGLKKALETITLRELRTIFYKISNQSRYRMTNVTNNLSLQAFPSPLISIREVINDFKPLHIGEYSKELLNNDKYRYN